MVIIETSVFTRQVQKLLTDAEYQQLQVTLVERPDIGAVIVGSGGLRKVRWGRTGQGKRGRTRVIYYWAVWPAQLLLLLIYPKSEQDDLSEAQLQVLKKIIGAEYQ